MNILTRISRFDKKRSHLCLMLKVVSFERQVCFLRQARPFKLSDRFRKFDFHWLLAAGCGRQPRFNRLVLLSVPQGPAAAFIQRGPGRLISERGVMRSAQSACIKYPIVF